MRIDMKNRTFHKILIYALLVLWAVIVLFPLYWIVLTSAKSYSVQFGVRAFPHHDESDP